MTFRNRLQYLLVKQLRISNKQALSMILEGLVLVNDEVVRDNILIQTYDRIVSDNQIVREGKKLIYIAFYKPRGIETTFNTEIKDNLKEILNFPEDVFHVGRLDKESEGLLLLTNDGRVFDKTLRQEHKTEKEYIVTVDKLIDADFIKTMANGVTILGKTTLPCQVEIVGDYTFKIILIQGINRQIRRMCYKLGYEVTRLLRVRIGKILLGELKSGEHYFY
jgi:23S rRNA pseudouridine2604 synthase